MRVIFRRFVKFETIWSRVDSYFTFTQIRTCDHWVKIAGEIRRKDRETLSHYISESSWRPPFQIFDLS